MHEAYNRRPKALAHADVLAEAVDLDMAAAGWTPTVDGYLGRVTKARILEAVREAKGTDAAERIASFKKGEMAEKAEALLAGSRWLPEPLRTRGQAFGATVAAEAPESVEADHQAEADVTEAEDTVQAEHLPNVATEDEEAWPLAAE